jgi:hypothetical protein
VKAIAVLAACSTVVAVPAAAAAPLVPPFIQGLVAKRAGTTAYVPTRAPLRYAYASYTWDGIRRALTIRLTDRRYANRAAHTITFTARPFRGDCARGNEKGFQVDGNRTYSADGLAWRCLNGAKLSAAGQNLPEVALAQVVASARRAPL